MKRRSVWVVTVVWIVALAAMGMLNAAMPLASAAESPASEVARPVQNSVEWLVNSDTFESNYPGGFTVTLDASSAGGEIVRASLVWHRASLRDTQALSILREVAEIDPETGLITATWTSDATVMLPPWSLLAYHWELRDAAGNSYQTESMTAEYADNTRKWDHSESDDAVVYSQGLSGDIESQVLDAMAQQYDTYVEVWGAPLPYKPRIVLFGDFDAWLEWRTADHNTSETQVVVGQTFDEWGVIAQVVLGNDLKEAYHELAYGTVVHEIEHLYQAEFVWPTRRLFDVPGWFMEGDATFFELYQTYDYLAHVQDMARSGELPPLLVNQADAPSPTGEFPRDAYDIGYSFFVWLEETTGGLEAHHDLMALLAANTPFFDALQAVTGLSSTQEIERSWRQWLGATGDAPTLVPTWTPQAIPMFVTPTPFGQ